MLVNSRFKGADSSSATDWYRPDPDTAPYNFVSGTLPEHRAFRSTSTGPTDRARIGQNPAVEAGKIYTLSCRIKAIHSVGTPDSVILNTVSWGTVVTGLTERPTQASGVVGERSAVTFRANITGAIELRVGCETTGDFELEEIMLDEGGELRPYVASDPAEPSLAPIGLGVPYKSNGMMPALLNSNHRTVGLMGQVPIAGTLVAIGFECASNNPADFGDPPLRRAKSGGTGVYTLQLKLTAAQPAISGDGLNRQLALPAGLTLADAMMRPDFSTIHRTGSVTHNRGTNTGDGDRRRHHVWTLPTPLAVAEGQWLALVGYAKASNAANDFIAFTNSPTLAPRSSVQMTGAWLTDPNRAYSPREGFQNFGMIVRESTSNQPVENAKRYVRMAHNGQITFYFQSGLAYGQSARENNGLTRQLRVGGKVRARERFRHLGRTFSTRNLWLPCYWDANGSIPTSNLTVDLVDETTGKTWTGTAAPAPSGTNTASTVRGYSGGVHTATDFPDFTRFDLGASRSITSGHDFRIEVSSADGTRLVRLFGLRHAVTAYDVTDSPPPATTGLTPRVGQDDPAVLSYAERSTDGGDSWSKLTLYSPDRTDVSLSFWLEP